MSLRLLFHARRRAFATLLSAVLVVVFGCSQPSSDRAPQPSETPAPAASAAAPTNGPHRVFGQAPVSNGQPSIVVLSAVGEKTFPAPAAPPVMDQAVLTFIPDVLFVRTGQPTEFRNNDDTLHNINVREDETKTQAFNVAIPTGAIYNHTFGKDGFYGVRCDIHPAMAALIVSTSSPYAIQTDAAGGFAFDDVEAGAYVLRVYAGSQTLEKTIEVVGPNTEASVGALPGS